MVTNELVFRAKSGHMTEKEYMGLMKMIIDRIFQNWDGKLSDFARESGLCLSTIYRYFNMVGRRPQLRTVLRMAKAAGIRMVFDFVDAAQSRKRGAA